MDPHPPSEAASSVYAAAAAAATSQSSGLVLSLDDVEGELARTSAESKAESVASASADTEPPPYSRFIANLQVAQARKAALCKVKAPP